MEEQVALHNLWVRLSFYGKEDKGKAEVSVYDNLPGDVGGDDDAFPLPGSC